jgi:hypothetical protein
LTTPKNLGFLDNPKFEPLLLRLLPVSYDLLIQQHLSLKRKNRYVLFHFHVKIDWPIDEAAEAMAKQLCYISTTQSIKLFAYNVKNTRVTGLF